MTKKKIIKLITVLGVLLCSSCLMDENDEIGIMGYLQDDSGNPLSDVSISYRNALISVQSDSSGVFSIAQPKTLYVTFKKPGYRTVITRINNFSEEASYDLKKITLNAISDISNSDKEVSVSTDPKFKNFKIVGTVSNSLKEPLKNVAVSLIDSTRESYARINDGQFNFRILENQISINKSGFKKLLIESPVYAKEAQKIVLMDSTDKTGIYILKSGKYIPLPRTKLKYKSQEKIGRVLWGGDFAYNITDFFFPKDIKEFKIADESTLRFMIFEPEFSSNLFEVQSEEGYICTANYKMSTSPFPSSKKEPLSIDEVYPPKYSTGVPQSPKIIEFKPSKRNVNYVFVNSKNKMGYYFTH